MLIKSSGKEDDSNIAAKLDAQIMIRQLTGLLQPNIAAIRTAFATTGFHGFLFMLSQLAGWSGKANQKSGTSQEPETRRVRNVLWATSSGPTEAGLPMGDAPRYKRQYTRLLLIVTAKDHDGKLLRLGNRGCPGMSEHKCHIISSS
jgi:hypothetical protein